MYQLVSIIIVAALTLIAPPFGFIAGMLAIYFYGELDKKKQIEARDKACKEEISRHESHGRKLISALRRHADNGDALAKTLLGQALLGIPFHVGGSGIFKGTESMLEYYYPDKDADKFILSDLSKYPDLHDKDLGLSLINEGCERDQHKALVTKGYMIENGICFEREVQAGREIIEAADNAEAHKAFVERSEQSVTEPELWGFDEGLKLKTKRGELVRSEAERVIANKLFDAGIDYQYERAWVGSGYVYKKDWKNPNKKRRVLRTSRKFPDFTIHTQDDRWIIWEHLGMIDDPEYSREWIKKRHWYMGNGFRPGETLLISRNSEDIEKVFAFLLKDLGIDGSSNEVSSAEPDDPTDNNEPWKFLWDMNNGYPVVTRFREQAVSVAKTLAAQNSIITRIYPVNVEYWTVAVRESVRLSPESIEFLEGVFTGNQWRTVNYSFFGSLNSGNDEYDTEDEGGGVFEDDREVEYIDERQEIRDDVASDVWDYSRAELDGWFYPD